MKTVTVPQMMAILAKHAGKFFAVDFVKKDKSLRHMVCRTGVKAYVKGEGRSFRTPELYLTVWDAINPGQGAERYRTIIINTIFKIKVAGQEYDVTHN